MANEITITKAAMSQAYIEAKQKFGLDLCRAERLNSKGVSKTRTEIGIAISGNRSERDIQATNLTLKAWARGEYESLHVELLRVFTGLTKAVESFNKHINGQIAMYPELGEKLRLVKTTNVGKLDIMAMVAIVQQFKGAEKGEKAKLLACFRQVNEYELFVQSRAREITLALPAPATA